MDQIKTIFKDSDLEFKTLQKIWDMADLNKDGKLNGEEYALAKVLIKMAQAGNPLPTSIPGTQQHSNYL